MAGEWLRTTIGELIDAEGGSIKTGPFGTTLKASEYSIEGVPLISVREIGYGTLRVDDSTPRVPPAVTERLPEYLLRTGDVVFGRKGAIDRSAHINREHEGWFLGSDGIRLRLPETCDSRFMAYQIQSTSTRAWLIQHATGTTMASLNQGVIERVPIVSPPLDVQRTIAHILGTLDDKIELNRRMNETLEEMARAIFKSWFVDFDPVCAKAEGRPPGLRKHIADLFPNRFESSELGEIPAGWEVDELGNLIELAYGKALKKSVRKAGDIMVFGSNGQVGWHNEHLVKGPGIIVGRKGNPGFVAWSPMAFFPIDTTFYVDPKDERLSLPFLFYALKAQALPALAADSAVPGLNRNFVYQNWQIVPSAPILDIFDSVVDVLFQRIHESDGQSRTLAAIRDALLPRLISGELRVGEAARKVEEVL